MRTQLLALSVFCAASAGCQRPDPCVETLATSADRRFTHVWSGDDGTVHAFGPQVLSRRDADGNWTDESLPATAYGGASTDDTTWLLTEEGPWFRRNGGAWVQTHLDGIAGALWTAQGVRTVAVERDDGPRVTVQSWDGSEWQPNAVFTPNSFSDSAFLPTGDAIVLGERELFVQTDSGFEAFDLGGGFTNFVTAAPDGTVVTYGGDLLIGTPESMAPIDGWGGWWFDVAALSDSDVWFLGQVESEWVIAHWNGVALAILHRSEQPLHALTALPDGSVVAVGGARGRLVVRGDVAGFSTEVDAVGIPSPHEVTVDDSTGHVWAFGPYTAATGRSRFRGVDTPFVPTDVADVVISDGRALFEESGRLVVDDAGRRATFAPGARVEAKCAAGGTLYGFSNGRVHRYSGAWESLEVDLPGSFEVTSCWADNPDTVFLGFFSHEDEVGGVARLDSETISVVATGWERAPEWMARQADGALWVDGGSDGITRRLQGQAFERVEGVPETTRQVHLRSDGTLFALHEDAHWPNSLSVRASEDSPWELLVRVTGTLSMAGWNDDVWAVGYNGGRPVLWSNTCHE